MYYNNYTYLNYSQYNSDTNLIFVNCLDCARGYRIRTQQTVLLLVVASCSILSNAKAIRMKNK